MGLLAAELIKVGHEALRGQRVREAMRVALIRIPFFLLEEDKLLVHISSILRLRVTLVDKHLAVDGNVL